MAVTFAELFSRLPKAKQTDRLKVLLALLVRGATAPSAAISSSAVTEELKLRLRGKAPANATDALRRAAPDVECKDIGAGKLAWFITQSGLSLVSASVGVEQSALLGQQTGGAAFDIAFVCALHRPELDALLASFGGESAWNDGPSAGQPHLYKNTKVVTDRGTTLRLVAGAPTYMGLTATAIISTQMIMQFKPKMIVMVGIAAGTRANDRGFGDILIANPSIDYGSGKILFQDGQEVFQPDPRPLQIHARLHTLAQESARTRTSLDDISARWSAAKPPTQLNVHIGPLGAADQVVDSSHRLAGVQKNWRKLIGIEMETYALYRAAHEAPHPTPLYMSFKSVCDFAAEKTDSWQAYAAYTAAQYARSFILAHWENFPLGG